MTPHRITSHLEEEAERDAADLGDAVALEVERGEPLRRARVDEQAVRQLDDARRAQLDLGERD